MTRKFLFLSILCVMGAALILSSRSRAAVEVSSGPDNGIVVTLTETDRSALALGDSLRKTRNFDDAFVNYQQVMNDNDVVKIVRAEAEHNIGLCLIELGRYDEAESLYDGLYEKMSDDADAKAYTRYSLAWMDVQRERFDDAISLLQTTVNDNNINDREIQSKSHFMIGRIYALFLLNSEKAQEVFKDVRNLYPDTEIANHPYLQ